MAATFGQFPAIFRFSGALFVSHIKYVTLVKFMNRMINITRMKHETHIKQMKHVKYYQQGTFSKKMKIKEFHNNLAGLSRSSKHYGLYLDTMGRTYKEQTCL